MNLLRFLFITCISLSLVIPDAESATEPSTLEATLVYQAPASLAAGGDLQVLRSRLRLSAPLLRNPGLYSSWNLSWGHSHYEIGSRGSAPSAPWRDIYHVGGGVSLLKRFSRSWGLLLSPSIDVDGEGDAEVADSLRYGLFSAVTWNAGRDRQLGFGVVVSEGLEESDLFPVIIIDWKLSDRWRIANPLRVGVTGPAGLELRYQAGERWEIGVGGAWRTLRFRLAEDATGAGGIGEERLVPVWIRASRAMEPLKLILYAGASLEGRLTLEDRHGRELSRERYGAAPFLGVYLSGSF